MTKTALLAIVPIKPEAKKDFDAAMELMFTAVREERGTELYILSWGDIETNTAYIYEVYTDSDAVALHAGSDAMKNLMGALGDMINGKVELIALTPAAAKGIDL